MPSRRPDTAEQRLWLGPDRHRRRRGDTITNSEPESHAHTNSFGDSMRADSYAIANSYRDGHRHGDIYSFRDT